MPKPKKDVEKKFEPGFYPPLQADPFLAPSDPPVEGGQYVDGKRVEKLEEE